MLSFDDPRWGQVRGGYRSPYDPRKALLSLERSTDVLAAWSELHHQGDVGEASYAAAPHLVRIHGERDAVEGNTYALAVVIERARREHANPQMPSRLGAAYDALSAARTASGRERDHLLCLTYQNISGDGHS
jgi:hypothetical protein